MHLAYGCGLNDARVSIVEAFAALSEQFNRDLEENPSPI